MCSGILSVGCTPCCIENDLHPAQNGGKVPIVPGFNAPNEDGSSPLADDADDVHEVKAEHDGKRSTPAASAPPAPRAKSPAKTPTPSRAKTPTRSPSPKKGSTPSKTTAKTPAKAVI